MDSFISNADNTTFWDDLMNENGLPIIRRAFLLGKSIYSKKMVKYKKCDYLELGMNKMEKLIDSTIRFLKSSIFKFALVGVVNTLVGWVAMFMCLAILRHGGWFSKTVNYWTSSAVNIVIGSIVSYILNKHFTFESDTDASKDVWRFIINVAVCYLVAYGIARPIVMPMVAKASSLIKEVVSLLFGSILFTVINYFGQRFYVFREDK